MYCTVLYAHSSTGTHPWQTPISTSVYCAGLTIEALQRHETSHRLQLTNISQYPPNLYNQPYALDNAAQREPSPQPTVPGLYALPAQTVLYSTVLYCTAPTHAHAHMQSAHVCTVHATQSHTCQERYAHVCCPVLYIRQNCLVCVYIYCIYSTCI